MKNDFPNFWTCAGCGTLVHKSRNFCPYCARGKDQSGSVLASLPANKPQRHGRAESETRRVEKGEAGLARPVVIIRTYRPKLLNSDNAGAAIKALRDRIADYLNLPIADKDDDHYVDWRVEQYESQWLKGTYVEIRRS